MEKKKYERTRQSRWDKLHIRSATCRIPAEDYTRLKVACWCDGITVHRLLRSYIAWYLKQEYGERGTSQSLDNADVVFLELLKRNM